MVREVGLVKAWLKVEGVIRKVGLVRAREHVSLMGMVRKGVRFGPLVRVC